ncbi:MAG: hypothetical protein CML22_06905 [Rheinheimera sp.]|nr:hypothetical protein [Rheinheimera sp.]MBM34012.1 hypothetical protein [Rheinheimera sp.]|tara:strand:+ start:2943 stop:3278 length:336 start_codon:yes stop_codon:yes gene_type:complete
MKVVVFGEKNGVACNDVYDFSELQDVASCLADAEKRALSAGLKNVISMTEGQAKLFISGVIRNLNYPEDSLELDFELKDSSHRDESNIGLKMKVKNEGLEPEGSPQNLVLI